MKRVLWVISRPLSGSFDTPKTSSSGSWLDAAYDGCCHNNDIELHIATVGKVDKIVIERRSPHVLYLLPGGGSVYNENSGSNLKSWKSLKEISNPDIVQIWGTECDFAKLVLTVFSDIPSLVYIQGVMDSVARGYDAGLSFKTQMSMLTPYDILHRSWIYKNKKRYAKRAIHEREILNMATAAIVENDWCEDQIKSIAPNCRCYRSNLPIKKSFWERKWLAENFKRHTIFTNAGGLPLKGHHILFEALKIIIEKYPDVKLYIPGVPLNWESAKKDFHTNGYSFFLSKMIKKYKLQNNIEYVGLLSDKEMAEYLSKVNVYVMPSYIENHSSSLIEAQIVGTPCVSSFVGGTASVVKDGVNALLYSYPDAASIAGHVCRIFESDALAQKLSLGANFYRQNRTNNVGAELMEIYKKM